jgi:hypothetical protein
MKSQLLQDINEVASSAAASPAAKRPEPHTQAKTAEPGFERAEPGFARAEPSPFASDRPDWQGAQPEPEPHWFDRWGRRVAGWSVGIGLSALVAGGGYWLYRDSSIENTLVQVARNSAPALQTGPPTAAPALSATSAAASGAASVPASAPAATAAPAAMPEPAADTPALAAAPEPATRKPSQLPVRPASIRPRHQAFVPPVAAETEHTSQLADTLKQCRALGYHASQCLKRGCTTTRYGLACKG